MKPIILLGAGGHCRSCIEVIESTGEWEIAGLLDSAERRGQIVLGYEIIGTDADLPGFAKCSPAALVTVGQISSCKIRRRLFDRLRELAVELPLVVAATARVSPHALLQAGTIVMHHGLVNAGARIGANCILNTGSIIEHDAVVGDHCHVSTGALVNGDCSIGEGSFIGSGAVIKHGVQIAPGCVVGAGAVVTQDLIEAGIYIGCPARRKT